MNYQLTIDWQWDFILLDTIKTMMKLKWMESCYMAKYIKRDEHYWGDYIDHLADIELQILNENHE